MFLRGHRVATQYLLSALEGAIPAEHLLHYREANYKLPGHPELGLTPGVKFSSGRLGHMWYVSFLASASYYLTRYLIQGLMSTVFLSQTVTRPSSALVLMVLNRKVTMLKLQGSQLPKDSTSNCSSMTMTLHLPDTLLNT
jgi:Transketolase, thiamine diphosphate binding domain